MFQLGLDFIIDLFWKRSITTTIENDVKIKTIIATIVAAKRSEAAKSIAVF